MVLRKDAYLKYKNYNFEIKAMSKSLLYHGFGLKGVEYLKTEYREGTIYFHIKTSSKHLECSSCKGKEVIKKGKKERIFRTVSIGFKPVFMVAHIHRLQCKTCGLIRQEEIKYADKKNLYPSIKKIYTRDAGLHDNK